MKSAQKLGIGLIVFGLFFLVVNFIMLKTSNSYFPKLLLTGIIVTVTSIGFLVRPGADVTIENNNDFLKDLWRESENIDKIVWVGFLLLSLVACYLTFQYFGLSL